MSIALILIARLIVSLFITGLFLYSKLLPYKDKLGGQYRSIFYFFNSVFEPTLRTMRKFIKPVQVGHNLGVDLSQVILLILLLALYQAI
ncbi:MAG: YggT family protein [Taibaiella sp.]|nr:YggT family protein [Taibaiella sp.]